MKKNSNKGFTLIELIIAMGIMSIVVFIGYRTINGLNKASVNQTSIFNEQQAANLVNKYLTKDLELSKNITNLESADLHKYRDKYDISYGYKISNGKSERIDYIVGIKDSKYDLIRISDSIEIYLIEKLKVKDNEKPFCIDNDNTQNRNLYNVKIYNLDNSYEFKINPRYTDSSRDIIQGHDLVGDGNIIVHKTKNDKSVIINSTEGDKYKQKIKVTRSNDGNIMNIMMDKYEFKINIEVYDKYLFKGTLNINGSVINIDNKNINNNDINLTHKNVDIVIRKSNDGDLIIKINEGNSNLVKFKKDISDNDVCVKLYNEEVEIDIDEDNEVEIEIGDSDHKNSNLINSVQEMEVKIADKYIKDIYGVFINSQEIGIKSVELNDLEYKYFGHINFEPSKNNKLNLDIDTDGLGEEENIVEIRFSSQKYDEPIEQIYGDIKIERKIESDKLNYLEITYPNKNQETIDIGRVNGQYYLTIHSSINISRNNIELKLLPTSKILSVYTDKQIKIVEVNNKNIEVENGKTISLGEFRLNPGQGLGNKNNEITIKLKGN